LVVDDIIELFASMTNRFGIMDLKIDRIENGENAMSLIKFMVSDLNVIDIYIPKCTGLMILRDPVVWQAPICGDRSARQAFPGGGS
jgi:response regulator of citrate/malate metabolism